MKGIILAGGLATRLYPITKGISKQLLPVYDKPMIYYPLSVLMMAGIKDILIISTPEALPNFQQIFQDGSHLGLNIQYQEQLKPRGLAEAFILGEKFIQGQKVCMILGDNIFYGAQLGSLVKRVARSSHKSTIFAYNVAHPEQYGVVEFNTRNRPVKIVEKPKRPKSNWAVTGIYFFDKNVCQIAKRVKPSARGEIEITEVIDHYIQRKTCHAEQMGRGMAWLDTGTHDSLQDASQFIRIIEERQGLKIGCIEEIAYHEKFITRNQLLKIAKEYKTAYGDYLKKVAQTH